MIWVHIVCGHQCTLLQNVAACGGGVHNINKLRKGFTPSCTPSSCQRVHVWCGVVWCGGGGECVGVGVYVCVCCVCVCVCNVVQCGVCLCLCKGGVGGGGGEACYIHYVSLVQSV